MQYSLLALALATSAVAVAHLNIAASSEPDEVAAETETDSTIADATTDAELDTGTDTGAAVEPYCGDGNLDPDERCDDGNLDGLDGCNAHCTEPGVALWDAVLGVGTAAVDVDGSIYFATAGEGLQQIDHESGKPTTLNRGLALDLLSTQAPGRLVGIDWNTDVLMGLDTTGEVLWTVPLQGRLRALTMDGMGNAIMLEDDHTLSSIDSSGAINWQTMAFYAINPLLAADRAGIYIASGDLHEHWLYGLDADDGSVDWDINEADYDAVFSAIAAANGRIVIVGSERVGEDDNYVDFVVRSYDSRNGELAWTDRIDGPSNLGFNEADQGHSVIFDVAGRVIVAGTLGMDDAMRTALLLGRYSADGTLLSSETLDDRLAHRSKGLTALPDGDLLVTAPDGRLTLFMP